MPVSIDTHDDPNGPTLQLDPGNGQGYHITMNILGITYGVTPPKRAVLPEW